MRIQLLLVLSYLKFHSFSSFKECLNSINGAKSIYSNNDEYKNATAIYNTRIETKPLVVVQVKSENQIQSVLKCSNTYKKLVSVKAGGHSYEGYSLGGSDGHIIIDISSINSVTIVKNKKIASVGAGIKLGSLYNALYKEGYLLNAGDCLQVGFSGQVLGGGFGFFSRKYGMTLDQVEEMTLILANGTIVQVSKREHKDLYFALRGGGHNNFGIVTSFKLELIPLPKQLTSYSIVYDFKHLYQVLKAFKTWGNELSDEMSSSLIISNTDIQIYGVCLCSERKTRSKLEYLIRKTPQAQNTSVQLSDYLDAIVVFDSSFVNLFGTQISFKAKSFFADPRTVFKPDASAIMTKYMSNLPPNSSGFILIDLFGGIFSKVNKISKFETAFIHRNEFMNLQILITVNNDADLNWINSFYKELDQFSSGYAYQNYYDRDLENWQKAYYGDSYYKLENIKKTVDPNNVFNYVQGIK